MVNKVLCDCDQIWNAKSQLLYGILAANLLATCYAFPVLLWPPVSWLADDHCNYTPSVSLVFSPPNLSVVSWPTVTKLSHM